MKTQGWISITTCLALTGCIDGDLDAEFGGDEVGTVEQSVEIGTNDTSDPVRDAVVRLSWPSGSCTGVLIAPNMVLTAAHCGWDNPSFATGNWTSISPITVSFGPDRSAPTATAIANAVSVPPLATSGPWAVDDIALLRLTTNVSSATAVPRPTYVDRPATLTSSSTIFQVGYGGGRDRRFMTGSNYRDWTTGAEIRNGFSYTATFAGPGIGDRDTNIESGDSGGPMLLGSSTGFVIGDLSHWTPYGIATFGPGGDGRPSVRGWLSSHAPQRPDFRVLSITAAGCDGTTGQPRVKVRIINNGVRLASGWVDVFHDQAWPPPIGTLSPIFRMSSGLAPNAPQDLYFSIPAPAGGRWIDVLLDTTQSVAELDETNNQSAAYVTLASCS